MIPRAAAQRKEEVSTRPWIYVRGVSVFPGVFLLFSMSSSSFFLLDLAGKNVKSRSQRSNYTARGQLRRDREFTNAIISIYKERERERERDKEREKEREKRNVCFLEKKNQRKVDAKVGFHPRETRTDEKVLIRSNNGIAVGNSRTKRISFRDCFAEHAG